MELKQEQLYLRKGIYSNILAYATLLKVNNSVNGICIPIKIFILGVSLWSILEWSRCAKNLAYRNKAWIRKARGKLLNAPKLENLPPATEAFHQYVHRSYELGLIWNACWQADPPPTLDEKVCKYSLYVNTSFLLVMVHYIYNRPCISIQ